MGSLPIVFDDSSVVDDGVVVVVVEEDDAVDVSFEAKSLITSSISFVTGCEVLSPSWLTSLE